MATLRLTGVEALQDRLMRTEQGWRDVSVPFKRAAAVIYASTKGRFAASGPGWKPVKRGGKPLRDTGRLMASVTSRAGIYREEHGATRHSLEVGTNVIYANVHQFGFKGRVSQNVRAYTRRNGVKVKAHSRTINQNIQARPFFQFDAQNRADIIQVFADWWRFAK